MRRILDDESLDLLFRQARTSNDWTDEPVGEADIRALYDLVKMGPTAVNSTPARFVWVVGPEAKARLAAHLSPGNVEKTLAAPATVIVGQDLDFPETLPRLFPHVPGLKDAMSDPAVRDETAFRNSSLQGAYLVIAARALGLDAGPMSGFDPAGVDGAFFAGTNVRTNFIVNIGRSAGARIHPRLPRLAFDEANRIL